MLAKITGQFIRNSRYSQWNKIFASSRMVATCNTMGNFDAGLVLGMYERGSGTDELVLTPTAENINKQTDNKLKELIKRTAMTGKLGSSMVFNNVDKEFRTIAVVGLGSSSAGVNELENVDERLENVRVAAGVGVQALEKEGCKIINIEGMDCVEAVAEGSNLAAWRFEEYKDLEDRKLTPKINLYDSPDKDAWTRGLFSAEAQNMVRALCETPASQMTPIAFAQSAVDCLCPCSVNVEVRSAVWVKAKKMTALLSVADSSCVPPCFVEVNYCGGEINDPPILLVGEGLTFNSGGVCLKKPQELPEYKASMAGAAIVMASIHAAAKFSLPLNISAVIPLCENMPSGKAFKPGDIVTSLNGKSILVHDTNNAGVLIMADALTYAQKTMRPKLVISVGTLSDGVQKAFGGAATGFFTNSHFIAEELQKAAVVSGDRVWELPAWDYYKKKVTNVPYVDISNTGQGKATSCLSAAVLTEFISCPDWLHLDVRGVGMNTTDDHPYLRKNHMSGRPTRTLIQFLYQLACFSDDILEKSR